MDKLKRRMLHLLGEVEQEGERFHHNTQSGVQFKIYHLFTSENFPSIF